MPVPAVLADLSTTLSNNSPPGAETIGTNLDDYLRAGFGLLAQVNANKLETSTASTTYAPIASPTFTGTASGTFSGNGSALTSLNATQLTSGTVPSARVAGAYTAITSVGNTGSAVSFAAAGNVTIAAPSSGTSLLIGGVTNTTNVLLQTSSTDTASYFNGTRLALQNVSATSGNYAGIGFMSQGSSDAAAIWSKITTHTAGATVASLSLGTNNGGAAPTERITIAAAGNVTINAPSSGSTLNVAAVSGSAGIYSSCNVSGNYSGLVIENTSTTGYAVLQTKTNGLSKFIRSSNTGALEVVNNANSAVIFSLADAGNVVIPTPSSGVGLTISGGGASITGTTALDATSTVGGLSIGYRNLPQSASTTAATTDVGKSIIATSTITIPNSTFAAGDCFTIYNNSAAAITLTCNTTTTRIAGTATTGATRTLALRGQCTAYFLSATELILSGNVT
jgi:hypothetical protein